MSIHKCMCGIYCRKGQLLPNDFFSTKRAPGRARFNYVLRLTLILLSICIIGEVTGFQCIISNSKSPRISNLQVHHYCHDSSLSLQRYQKYAEHNNLHGKVSQRNLTMRMSTKDDDTTAQKSKEVETKIHNESTSTTPTESQALQSTSRSTISKTLVLALPLMLKFALVLVIKFLTDLVVFPLLFTYRGARVMKRRLSKLWTRWTSSSKTTTTNGNKELGNVAAVDLEFYNVNGSVPSSDKR